MPAAVLKFCFASLILLINTLLLCLLMVPFALIKLVLPFKPVRRAIDPMLMGISALWIDINSFWLGAVNRIDWRVTGADGLDPRGWYLVASNHQSWVDILVLQKVFNRRIPMLKFFLKKELIYVPILGLAWWHWIFRSCAGAVVAAAPAKTCATRAKPAKNFACCQRR